MADVEYVGPFQEWQVVVDGRGVPHITAVPLVGGKVRLVLDSRMGLVLDVTTAEAVVPFLADAIAVAKGYTCHPRPRHKKPRRLSPFQRSHPVEIGRPE